MAIDQADVKKFWDERAKTYQDMAFESVAGLEQDPDNLKLKIGLECNKVFDYLPDVTGKRILDLGAGVGQWAFRFAERGAHLVKAVEYSADLCEVGRKEARDRGADQVNFVVSPAEDYVENAKYDIVYISGLFVNMNDDQVEKIATNLPMFCDANTCVILRDGMAREKRYELNKAFSQHLQTEYSAIYRTRETFIEMFARNGFTVSRDENVFDEGCPLNKYPETRLHIYEFRYDGT